MDGLFNAESVVVVGVSESKSNLARSVFANMVKHGFKGEVYAVGPRGGEVFGRPIYRSIPELPASPELAVFLTPARFVAGLLAQCGEKGTRWAIIESAGFQELGAEGEILQQEILQVSKKYGIRFIGPNCLGAMNTARGLYTPFVPIGQPLRQGKIGVFAQSGGVALNLLSMLYTSGAAISKFVSMGNKLDLDEVDYLAYGLNDPETEVIFFYLEGFKRGRAFMDLASGRPVGPAAGMDDHLFATSRSVEIGGGGGIACGGASKRRRKPIILLKSNTSDLSLTIAQSHTAALAADDRVVDAVCREAGILRVQSLAEAVNAAKGLSLPPLKGKNLAVLSRSGGHAVLVADHCAHYGFNLPPLDPAIIDEAQSLARAGVIRMGNPLDLGDVFDFSLFFIDLLESILRQPDIDGAVLFYAANVRDSANTRSVMEKVAAVAQRCGKPVATVIDVTFEDLVYLERNATYPFFLETVDAIRALAAGLAGGTGSQDGRSLSETGKPASAPHAIPPSPRQGPTAKISTLIPAAGPTGRQPLLHEALELMDIAGIPTVPWRMTKELDEAVEASEVLGYPVALKAVAPSLLHKSDKGALALGIMDAQSLRNEWLRLQKISGDIVGIVVQKMAQAASRELVVGGKRDPSFGPIVLTGLGGIMVEVLKDVSIRLAPVDTGAALEMLGELAGKSILGPFRGMHAADLEAAARIISQVSHLMSSFPQIREMDLNPVSLNDDGVGAVALDARVLIGE